MTWNILDLRQEEKTFWSTEKYKYVLLTERSSVPNLLNVCKLGAIEKYYAIFNS